MPSAPSSYVLKHPLLICAHMPYMVQRKTHYLCFMKSWISICLLLIVAACGNAPKAEKASPVSEAVKYAKHFKIVQRKGYTELQILNPEKGGIEKKYALIQKNENTSPPADLIPVEVPLKSVVALSGTHIGMLEKIHCADKVSGISSQKYIANPTVLKGCVSGKVLEFDDFGMLNPERVLQTKARMIVYSGFEGAPPPNEDKLLKLGILCLPNYDWKENHPLGKAEWIKLFGVLFGKEKAANDYFNAVEKEYNALKESAEKINEKPTLFSGMVFGDSWYMPAGESFGAKLFEDAGGDYVAKNEKGTGSAVYSFEQVFKSNQNTQFWLNVEVPTQKEMLQANARYQYFDAFKKGRVYSYSHAMNLFWENSAIEPHHVLSDLIQILHEGRVEPEKLYFYRKLKP